MELEYIARVSLSGQRRGPVQREFSPGRLPGAEHLPRARIRTAGPAVCRPRGSRGDATAVFAPGDCSREIIQAGLFRAGRWRPPPLPGATMVPAIRSVYVNVGKRPNGGYASELDIVAFNPDPPHLVHIEPSMDCDLWIIGEKRFAAKFEAGRKMHTRPFFRLC